MKKTAIFYMIFLFNSCDPVKEPFWNTFYYITIKIEELFILNHETNEEIKIDEIVFRHAAVGWIPG